MKLFLIGFMGSGKTHWGKLLSEKLHLPFFDLDKLVADTEGKTITQIFAEMGEEYFRYKEKQVLEEVVVEHNEFIISCGGGTPCFFNNINFMKKHGKVIWLNTQVDVLVNRLIHEKSSRPILRDIPAADLKPFILKKLLSRKLYYQQADITVSEESLHIDNFVQIIADA
jgi:shikimate kinase